jgi:Mg2+-importing ATPase
MSGPASAAPAAATAVRRHSSLFTRFLHRRRVTRLYRRPAWWGHRVGDASHQHAATVVGASMLAAARMDEAALCAHWRSSPAGLAEATAARLRRRIGPNQIETEKPLPWPVHLWQSFRNPFSLLLTLLAAVSWATADLRSALVIGTMVALSTLLRFVQERQSSRAADALKALVSSRANVLRPGEPAQELPMAQLVPGDVVQLAAGDMIPADCRLLAAKDLFVNQSAMTGEAMPVEKRPGAREVPAGADALGLDNLVFMGSNVVSGAATALVLATGTRTFFGTLAEHAAGTERPPTQFQAGVNRVSWLLIRFMLVMVPLVLLINGFGKGDWLQAFLFALSVAVGLTPEMLPMIVTSTLAKGAVALSRRKVIVKRLDAIQNFGAMDVLCTDKTGTLTQDHIVLKRHLDPWGAESDEVLRLAWLNSHHQTGLKNLLDQAVLSHDELQGEAARWTFVDEMPFDFQRRRMSVVLAPVGAPGQPLLICKGAVEEILAQCQQVRRNGQDEPLTPAHLAELQATAAALNDDGLRVVAVAVKALDGTRHDFHASDECEMTLVGHVAFLDPPKESTAPALKALAAHGIAIKVLTGDNERVTLKVCRDVGLVVSGVLLGPEVQAMDDAALAAAVASHNVFAKLAPQHKERIVAALRAGGHVVGFMGDGINDAPALHAADIGISVDTAVDIAKEVADLILLEKSLLVLDEGVVEGRKTFANMLKYIKMTASSNFGNVLSVLVASVALPFLPMLPMHLLVQNLLYDFSQVPIPFDRVDDDLLARPMRWDPAGIGRFMLFFGPLSSIFDLATFALMWWGLGAQTVAQQTLFQSGWFVEGLLTQTLVVHLIRTARIPFVQSRASPALMATGAAVVALGLWLPMGPLAPWLKLQPLPGLYFAVLPLLLLGYMALVQGMKGVWTRRFGWH